MSCHRIITNKFKIKQFEHSMIHRAHRAFIILLLWGLTAVTADSRICRKNEKNSKGPDDTAMIGRLPSAAQSAGLSPNDPSSFSNPEDVHVEHFHIKWMVDFNSKMVTGSTTYNVIRHNPKAQFMILDCKDVTIKSVIWTKKPLEYKLGDEVNGFGRPLRIKLPELDKNGRCVFTISYTTAGTSCFLWLSKELTTDKTHPYMFSQGQAINVRSVMPCQDTPSTKATYSAEVTVPSEFTVLMSAKQTGKAVYGHQATYKFDQSNPVPVYLIAIAIGKLASRKVGPRTTVYAEPSEIAAAAYEFGDTERMLQIAERIVGKYIWGDYNLLVLPRSFPFGGMENPCITFVTPSAIAGDRSLTDLIAHEICHSWTGNLVTFKSYEHFWLSEGPTMYLERQVMGQLHGESYRQFLSIAGFKLLKEAVMEFGPTSNATRMVPDLRGVDPEDVFSEVPYEKGYTFLYYLETKVGGSAEMLKFLKHYIDLNKFKSPDSETFKKQFIEFFTKANKANMIKDVEWDKWFYLPGMPIHENSYDDKFAQKGIELKDRWKAWNHLKEPCPFSAHDLDKFTMRSVELIEFLALILDDQSPFELEKVKAMETCYSLNSIKNAEIRVRWLRLCIRAKWIDQLPLIFEFLAEYGREKYQLRLYRALYEWDDARAQTIDTFQKQKSTMLPFLQKIIMKILNLS